MGSKKRDSRIRKFKRLWNKAVIPTPRVTPRPKSVMQKRLFSIIEALIWGTIVDGTILLLLVIFAIPNLVDWSLIVSLVIAEVPIGVFLNFLLGERRRSNQQRMHDSLEMIAAMEKFGHLEIYRADERDEFEYPELGYFVVNTKTNQGFRSPEYLEGLRANGIIADHKFDKKKRSYPL